MEVIQPNNEPTTSGNPTIIVNQPVPKSNGMGTAGFVLALLALFLGWVPVVGWILWVLGLIFSCVGVFRTPKGLAIAGLIIPSGAGYPSRHSGMHWDSETPRGRDSPPHG